jgi:hypothetical protein
MKAASKAIVHFPTTVVTHQSRFVPLLVIVDDGMYGKSSWISFSPSIVLTGVLAALILAAARRMYPSIFTAMYR